MRPYSVDPLPWKLKGYDFVSSEWKQTNTTKYTEMDSIARRQDIFFFYIWMAIVDVEIGKNETRELEEV